MDQTQLAEISRPKSPPTGIPGWGIDAPDERRVGKPHEGVFNPAENGAHWDRPEEQISDVKIFLSSERQEMTPVFGTTCPPKGVSGFLRGFAYSIHENKRSHWMMLMLSDRVDVLESTVSNLLLEPAVEGKPRTVRTAAVITLGVAVLAGAFFVGAKGFRSPATSQRKKRKYSPRLAAHS